MSGYTKLFNSILASTIWRADDKTRLVWITMLAMADKHGVVEASIPGLADFARVSLPDCELALEALSAPDLWSRSQEQEGRRIQAIDGGWWLINHGKYRASLSVDERREYLRRKQAEYRQRNRQRKKSTSVNNVSDKSTEYTQAAPTPSPPPQEKERSRAHKTQTLEDASPSARVVSVPHAAVAGQFLQHFAASHQQNEVLAERAGRFLERFAASHERERKVPYLGKLHHDYQSALEIVTAYADDTRLDLLVKGFMSTDHELVRENTRTVGRFKALASWIDERLRENGL